MNTLKLTGALIAMATVPMAQAAIVFQDDFTTDSSANYVVYRRNASVPVKPLDSKSVFSFDHSVAWPWDDYSGYTGTDPGLTIPPAPGASDSKAFYVRVNENQAENTTVESLIMTPKGVSLTGDYTITVDVWHQVTTSGTSTQLSLLGGANQGGPWLQNDTGTGYMFSAAVDGSSSRDYRQYLGKTENATVAGTGLVVGGTFYSTVGSGTGTWPLQNNNNSYYTALWSIAGGYKYAGAPAGKWVRMRIQRTGTVTKTSVIDVNTNVVSDICSIDDPLNTYSEGFPMLGMWDPAGSPRPTDQPLFVLFDNLKVEGTLGSAVSGTFALSDWAFGYPVAPAYEIYDELNASVVKSGTAQLDETSHSFNLVVPQGNYTLRFKQTSHWTGAQFAYDTTTGPANAGVMTLWNGDIDADNVISVFDYILLSDAFDAVADQDGDPGTTDPSPNWLAAADLDADGVISVFDYIILSDNFDKAGGW